jgi:hypothetical protein
MKPRRNEEAQAHIGLSSHRKNIKKRNEETKQTSRELRADILLIDHRRKYKGAEGRRGIGRLYRDRSKPCLTRIRTIYLPGGRAV